MFLVTVVKGAERSLLVPKLMQKVVHPFLKSKYVPY